MPIELVHGISPRSKGSEIAWVGVMGYEERWSGSLKVLAESNSSVKSAVALRYKNLVRPIREAGKRRALADRELQDFGIPEIRLEMIDPYDLGSLRGVLDGVARLNPGRTIVVDITCVTRAHALAIASFLVDLNRALSVSLAYSEPIQYSIAAQHAAGGGGWPDVILSPVFSDPYSYDPATESDGIILLGHEGNRLDLSLKVLTPKRCVVLSWDPRTHPELYVVARTANARLLSKVATGQLGPGWSVSEMPYGDICGVQRTVRKFVLARKPGSRVVLYPFGPKLAVMAAAVSAVATDMRSIWYMYPIRAWSRVDYTRELGRTRWLHLGDRIEP